MRRWGVNAYKRALPTPKTLTNTVFICYNILLIMTEFGVRASETLIESVRRTENEHEETLREVFLADKLFHDAHLKRAIAEPHRFIDELGRLQREFLDEKRGMNMGERFALALSDKYLGRVHVVELGSTTDPGVSGEIDGLKDEYRDLLRWMKDNGIVENELDRKESGRSVSLRKPLCPEAAAGIVIMIRNRPLINTLITHDGRSVGIGIAKRMVFSMPHNTLYALNAGTVDKNLTFDDERSLGMIETMLQHGSGGIRPIRTAYYLATEVHDTEED